MTDYVSQTSQTRNNHGKTAPGLFRSAFAIKNQGMVDGITSLSNSKESNPIQLMEVNVRENNVPFKANTEERISSFLQAKLCELILSSLINGLFSLVHYRSDDIL